MVYFFIFKLLCIEGKSFSHVGPISFQLFKLHNFWLAKSLEVIDHLNFGNYMLHENPRKKETNTGVKVSNQVEGLDMRSWWSVFFLSASASLFISLTGFIWILPLFGNVPRTSNSSFFFSSEEFLILAEKAQNEPKIKLLNFFY